HLARVRTPQDPVDVFSEATVNICERWSISDEPPDFELFAIREDRWQPGMFHQIDDESAIRHVFQLISDNDAVDVLLCHCRHGAPIFHLLDRTFDWGAEEGNVHLLGSLTYRRQLRQIPYLARS